MIDKLSKSLKVKFGRDSDIYRKIIESALKDRPDKTRILKSTEELFDQLDRFLSRYSVHFRERFIRDLFFVVSDYNHTRDRKNQSAKSYLENLEFIKSNLAYMCGKLDEDDIIRSELESAQNIVDLNIIKMGEVVKPFRGRRNDPGLSKFLHEMHEHLSKVTNFDSNFKIKELECGAAFEYSNNSAGKITHMRLLTNITSLFCTSMSEKAIRHRLNRYSP